MSLVDSVEMLYIETVYLWPKASSSFKYHKHRKFRGVKLLWFFNCRLEVKFHGFHGIV